MSTERASIFNQKRYKTSNTTTIKCKFVLRNCKLRLSKGSINVRTYRRMSCYNNVTYNKHQSFIPASNPVINKFHVNIA